ncbi:MAG: hypothetical protein V4530_01885 [Pseudomonadota bacterium]
MSEEDRGYLERRYRECLENAERASDPEIASIHKEFAAGHKRKLEATESDSASVLGKLSPR